MLAKGFPGHPLKVGHRAVHASSRQLACTRSALVVCKADSSSRGNSNGNRITSGSGKHMWTFDILAVPGVGPGSIPTQEGAGISPAGRSGRTSRLAGRQIAEIPLSAIIRPLGKTRTNDANKVAALMQSIEEIGLQEPIDVLLVGGRYYGFSGCHRFEAHVRLGRETILCRVRKANQDVLKMHMM